MPAYLLLEGGIQPHANENAGEEEKPMILLYFD